MFSGQSLKQLLLPCGEVVRLQHLRIKGGSQNDAEFAMKNFGAAQGLSSLELHHAYPSNLTPASWPMEMPCLQEIKLNGPGNVSPQWMAYSHLQCLSLARYQEASLPEWFSGMTPLKTLTLFNCVLGQFPENVLQLTQLESLCLSNNVPAFVFSDNVLCIAFWPHLRSFLLEAGLSAPFSLESKMILLQLKQRLHQFNPMCNMTLS